VTAISIHKLKPNKRNVRTHSKKQIRQIADSIKEFGFITPIVADKKNNILAGSDGSLPERLMA
jgi:ParB-like chromosome segregation protein Spo0J